MARDTRGKRRAQRKAAQGDGRRQAAGSEPRAAAPGAGPARPRSRRRPRRAAASRASAGRFVKESWAELKKVEWPGRSQVIQGTVVVIIACVIVGVYLYAADQFFKPFVRNVLLGE